MITIPAEHRAPDVERMDAAMKWLLRLRDENATHRDVTEWLNWYESDERNTQAFDAMQEFWQRTGQLGAGPDGVERIARIGHVDSVRETSRSRNEEQLNLRSIRRWVGRLHRPAGIGIAAGLMLVAGTALLANFFSARGPIDASLRTEIQPPMVRHTQLPDSSSVDLAVNSSVSVEYTATHRTLNLQSGEAFFSVAPNHARPFIVKAIGLRIRAVGTQFNVREADDRVVVTVAEGTVDVYPARSDEIGADRSAVSVSGALRLSAGNEVTWVVATGERIVRATDAERALAWRVGRLEFIDEPLAAVVADINRYSSRKLVIRDPATARLTYTGTVLIGSIDEWLRAMPDEFPIKVIASETLVTIGAAEQTAEDKSIH